MPDQQTENKDASRPARSLIPCSLIWGIFQLDAAFDQLQFGASAIADR